jgi:nucleoside-diphosphate-sugar epimerase
MKILVTGARGFVGGYISKSISSQHSVLAPTREELDLTDTAAVTYWFKYNQIDAVIHSAVAGRHDPFSTDPVYLTDSVLMFRNLWLNRHCYSKLINLGTAYEFDLSVDNSNVKEESVVKHLPLTSYGLAKNLIARIIKDTDNFYNLRLFGVFHETESSQRFFKKVIEQETITINNDQYFDYIYLEDIIPMIQCILNGSAQHRDINMVYPNKYRLSEVAKELCKLLGLDQNKIKIAANNGCNLSGDSSKLASYEFPLVGIHQGIRNYK